MSATASLNALLEQTADWDKDNRYMATSDLCVELQKDVKIDATMERRVCAAVLKQLDDQSNDVQSIAVKCLGVLLKKVQKAQVGEIADKLCSLILDGKDELRDIYSIGLKTLLKDMPDEMGATVCDKLTKRLLSGVQQSAKIDVKLESLENLTDLLKRFGSEVSGDHQAVLEIMLAQLTEKPVVKKRAASCLAALATSASDSLLEKLFGTLLARIRDKEGDVDATRTLIQTIGTISKAVGGRLGQHLDAVVPVFVEHVGKPEADDDDDAHSPHEMDELRENCFQGLESFVLRCPRQITPHLDSLISVSLDFIKYDPNYQDDDDDDDMMGLGSSDAMEEDGDDDEYAEEEEEYADEDSDGDDDDSSWKVRRAAVKLAHAIVSSRRELLPTLYEKVAPALISRFKEREENVRVDVVDALATLLRTSKAARDDRHHRGMTNDRGKEKNPPEEDEWPRILDKLAPSIVSAASKEICAPDPSNKCENSKAACFAMLGDLCAVHSLASHASDVSRSVQVGLSDRSQSLRLDAAKLLRAALDADESFSVGYDGDDAKLISKVAALVDESWYKLIAEGLRLVASLAKILGRRSVLEVDPAVAKTLFEAAKARLSAKDTDHEIKECAIEAVAALVANLPVLADSESKSDDTNGVTDALNLLLDRLKNESTRSVALRAIGEIAAAENPATVDLSSMTKDCAIELSIGLSRQGASRAHKQAALATLEKLLDNVKRRGDPEGLFADEHVIPALLVQSAKLISDEDHSLAQLASSLDAAALRMLHGKNTSFAAEPAKAETLPAVLELIASSPMLQGVALDAVCDLLVALAGFDSAGLSFDAVYTALVDTADASLASSKKSAAVMMSDVDPAAASSSSERLSRSEAQVLANVAKALAVLTASTVPSDTRRDAVVADFVGCASHSTGDYSLAKVRVATLAIGELGRRVDLSSSPHRPFEALMSVTTSDVENDDGKMAAAVALGLVASGAVASFLPALLEAADARQADASSTSDYTLLAALKEVVTAKCFHSGEYDANDGDHLAKAAADLAPFVDRLIARLVKSCDADDKPTRNLVAETLGALAWISPSPTAACLDGLLNRQSSTSPSPPSTAAESSAMTESEDDPASRARWTAAASLRYAASAWGGTSLAASNVGNLSRRARSEFFESMVPRYERALDLLDDADLPVRRQALIVINSCAHHQPGLVAYHLPTVVERIKPLIELKLERVVDLGPFKHKVDDGEPLRKEAVSCVITFVDNALNDMKDHPTSSSSSEKRGENTQILDSSFGKIVPDLVPLAVVALADKSDDIKMASHALLCKLCDLVPDTLVANSTPILESLDKTVNKKIKESTKAGSLESDRAYDLIRSGLKAALALAALPNAREARVFIENSQKKSKLAAEISRLQKGNAQ